MRTTQRIALLAAAAVLLVGGFLLANSGGSSMHRTSVVRHYSVSVAAGKPVGGVQKLDAVKGDTVGLTVYSNVADEVHVHGYDLHKQVSAGGTAQFVFAARIDGNFVIELESRNLQIASLTVKA